MERRYRVSEYAARLGVSTATVQRRIDKHLLPSIKDGIWYVLVDDKELVDVRTSVPADVRTSVPAVESLSGSEAVRAAQVEADVAEQEARKAEAERRIRDAKAGSLDNRAICWTSVRKLSVNVSLLSPSVPRNWMSDKTNWTCWMRI